MIKFLLTITLLFQLSAFGQTPSYEMELVETIPVETNLDNPDIRDAVDVWLEMINGAKRTLDIEQFYISPQKGEPLDTILFSVQQAAARGVKVRFIVDSRMYKTYPETVDKWKALNSSDVRAGMFPEARVIDFGKAGGGIQHAKFFIVDGEEIFLGSQNFDWRALKHIHELGIRLRHKEAVAIYQEIFDFDWKLAGDTSKEKTSLTLTGKKYDVPFQFETALKDTMSFIPTASPKSFIADTTLWDETHIVDLINSAKLEVVLQFLSYSTRARDKSYYSVIQDAIKRAAERGVRVKMIVSDWEKDHPAVDSLQALSTLPNIELKFSVIPDWSGGYVSFGRVEHCKFIVADGTSFWLGTSNCEKSYFYTSRNLGIVVHNNRLAGRLQDIFLKSWTGKYTEPIRMDETYTPREHGEKK